MLVRPIYQAKTPGKKQSNEKLAGHLYWILQMPIALTGFDDSPLCRGYSWQIRDEALLARLVAQLLLGRRRHVEQILRGSASAAPNVSEASVRELISQMQVPANSDPWHRDGWVFQLIAWIAVKIDNPDAIAAIPHSQPTNKGFDNLVLEVDTSGVSPRLSGVLICEEKATQNDRDTVRELVWPEFDELEKGTRDHQLLNEVTALLERSPHHEGVDDLLAQIFWDRHRKYRIAITGDSTRTEVRSRRRLFEGYDDTVQGDCERRRAEILPLADLRLWMDRFCAQVVAELERTLEPEDV